MEITVRDETKNPELRVRWYEGTSTFHIEVQSAAYLDTDDNDVESWLEVAVQTFYGDDKGNPPELVAGFRHARHMLADGSARELADAELRAR